MFLSDHPTRVPSTLQELFIVGAKTLTCRSGCLYVVVCAPAAFRSCGRDALVSTFWLLQIGDGLQVSNPGYKRDKLSPFLVATSSGLISVSAVSAGQVSRLYMR